MFIDSNPRRVPAPLGAECGRLFTWKGLWNISLRWSLDPFIPESINIRLLRSLSQGTFFERHRNLPFATGVLHV
jgi:hypothetical protein